MFEEINKDVGLTFRYDWAASDRFGWVRNSSLVNSGRKTTGVRLLDGLQNLLPYGAGSEFQLGKSTLLDAYKKNELLLDSGLGLFLLSSIPLGPPGTGRVARRDHGLVRWTSAPLGFAILRSTRQVPARAAVKNGNRCSCRARRIFHRVAIQIARRPKTNLDDSGGR